MVPLLNFIWISRNHKSIPDKCVKYVKSWLELNPSFKLRMWGNADIPSFSDDLLMDQWRNALIDEAMVSNRMRLLVINRVGGMYVDVDTNPIKPIEELIKSSKEFVLGACHVIDSVNLKPKLDLNIFYSEPSSVVLTHGLVAATGTQRAGKIADFMRDKYENRMTICPPTFFQDFRLTPETYSLHWPNRLATWVRPSSFRVTTRNN